MGSKQGRRHINWKVEPGPLVVGLAHYWWFHHGMKNKNLLWDKVEEELPKLSKQVLEKELTLHDFVRYIAATQDGKIVTPHKLVQRADKAQRNKEHKDAVSIVAGKYEYDIGAVSKDPRRTFTDAQLAEVAERDGYRCFYCHAPGEKWRLIGDHFVPHSKGGPTEVFNCVLACVRCHMAKGIKDPYSYGLEMGEINARGRRNLDARLNCSKRPPGPA